MHYTKRRLLMLTEAQFDAAAYRLCVTMGRNPNDRQNMRTAEYEINLWLKCMQAIELATKEPT